MLTGKPRAFECCLVSLNEYEKVGESELRRIHLWPLTDVSHVLNQALCLQDDGHGSSLTA